MGVGKGFFFHAFNFAFQARDADHLDPEENLCTAVPYSQLLSGEKERQIKINYSVFNNLLDYVSKVSGSEQSTGT